MKSDLHIAFMGTPEFAVPSLEILHKNNFSIDAVVTVPDKPAGRGRKISVSAIKKYALENNLLLLQPDKLKDRAFLDQLRQKKINLIVVVAFRILPQQVWSFPEFGTFNLHASLLPQYRGAAPINWAIINGEKQSGVTTFFIDKKIDTGKIIYQIKTNILKNDNAGTLHDKLMISGAELVLKTVQDIQNKKIRTIDQQLLIDDPAQLRSAPKIFMNDCLIKWNKPSENIFDFIRGLSPYPAAFTYLISPDHKTYKLKIFDSEISANKNLRPGAIYSDKKTRLLIGTNDLAVEIKELQLAGKKRMKTEDFLRGFTIQNTWKTRQSP